MPSKNTTKTFILKARAKHGNKYIYNKVHYKNNITKVKIGCKIKGHGYFEKIPSGHLSGQGCPRCSIKAAIDKRKMTKKEFIRRARQIHGEKYIYEEVVYVNNILPVNIICKKHGMFKQSAQLHISKRSGCQRCAIEKRSAAKRMTTEQFISKSIKIHGSKYSYEDSIYIDKTTKILIRCNFHNEIFGVTAKTHLANKGGCKKCTILSRTKTRKSSLLEQFLEKAIKIHENKCEYSNVRYVNCTTEIEIKCMLHNKIFMITPNLHLRGQRCDECNEENKLRFDTETKDGFIEQMIEKYGDTYDLSKVKYIDNRTEVLVFCHNHNNFFWRTPRELLIRGCPICSKCPRYTTEDFIEKANEIHNNIYNYEKVEYINAITPVEIICLNGHGSFMQTPSSHITKKTGCPKCSAEKISVKFTKSFEDFICDAIKVHKNKYNYSKSVYINNHVPIVIICNYHKSEFIQAPNSHLQGSGCPTCSREINGKKRRIPIEEFIEKANEIHSGKFSYFEVKYNRIHDQIKIYCNEHQQFFYQSGSSHLHKKQGCPMCSKIKRGMKRKMLVSEFIDRSNQIHLNNYDYSKVEYCNNKTHVELICPVHGSFFITPLAHLYLKQGCSKCSRKNYSRKAINWLNYVSYKDNIAIQHAECNGEFRIPGTKYKADGYCSTNNTIYEFHGCYYHGCALCFDAEDLNETTDCFFGDLFQKTINRESIIKSKGYNLVVMWEHDWTAMQNDPEMIAYNEKLTNIQNQAITIVNWYDPHNKIILNKIMGSPINLLLSFIKTAVSNMIQGKQFTI